MFPCIHFIKVLTSMFAYKMLFEKFTCNIRRKNIYFYY